MTTEENRTVDPKKSLYVKMCDEKIRVIDVDAAVLSDLGGFFKRLVTHKNKMFHFIPNKLFQLGPVFCQS